MLIMANTELVNFEALALEDDMSRRNDLARNVATLFSFTSETCSDEQIETYDHVLVRLADMVEAQARAFIADRLAKLRRAPENTVRRLAQDEIVVARPLLERSTVLRDVDLIEIARDCGDDHRMAIATREILSELVTDVLVEEGGDPVKRAVAENAGASLSSFGVSRLLDAASIDEELQLALAERGDLQEAEISRLAELAGERTLLRFAEQDRFAEVVATFAMLGDIGLEEAKHWMVRLDTDPFLIVAKACGLKASTVDTLLTIGPWRYRLPAAERARKGHAQTDAPAAGPPAAAEASAPSSPSDGLSAGGDHRVLVFKVRDALGQALQSLDALPQLTTRALLERSPDGTLDWVWKTAVVLVLAILAGTAVLRLVERWGRLRFLRFYDAATPERADRIAYLLSRAAIMAVRPCPDSRWWRVVIALAFVSGHPPSRVTALVGLEAVATFLLLRIVLLNVLAPGVSAQRMLRLEDRDAHGLYRSLIGLAALSHALFALRAGPFLGAGHRVVTLVWLPLTLLYFAGAFLVSSVRVLLDLPAALGLVGAPIMALLIWAVGYGVLVLVIDKWLLPRLDSDSAQAQAAEDIARAAVTQGESVDEDASLAQARAEAMDAEGARTPYRRLLEHGAAILSLVAAAAFLFRTWGIPLTDDSFFLANLFEIGLILFLGYMAYEAVAIAIDRQIVLEGGGADKKDDDHEIGGAGESRLATLLPIFRNFLLISIVVIAGMIALSQVGVNIAPLFAGAGVVGLAVWLWRANAHSRHFLGTSSRDWAVMKLAFRVTYDTDVEKMRKLIKKFGQELLEHPDYGPKFLQP
eukprot:jgi/Tetstr1/465446/TSEL_010130.t1